MRWADKAAGSAATRLRSSSTKETMILNAAGDNPTAAVADVGSRSDAPRDIREYDLELIYSG